jgi:hypothetical protein
MKKEYMKKEYKDFYRFLWEYLEEDKSAMIIKPRQCGMTQFAARYAAWCLDYKDMDVQLIATNSKFKNRFWEFVEGFRCNHYRNRSETLDGVSPQSSTGKTLLIADEIDWMTERDISTKMRGMTCQILGYSSINNMLGISTFLNVAPPASKGFQVFNISDTNESLYKMGKL